MQLLASFVHRPPPKKKSFLLTVGLATCSPMFLQCFGHGRPHGSSKGKPTRGNLTFLALALGLCRDIRHITAKMHVSLGMHTHLEAYAKQKLPDANQKYGRLASPKPVKDLFLTATATKSNNGSQFMLGKGSMTWSNKDARNS